MAATYEEIRDRVAAQLRPMFEAGKLRGWQNGKDVDEADRPNGTPPLWRLEHECAKRLRGLPEAFTVLLGCPFAAHGWLEYEMNFPLREGARQRRMTQAGTSAGRAYRARILRVEACGKAGCALSYAMLLMARTRRWYRPVRGEEPTTAELRRAA
jgi:hypothetical protein